MKSCKVCRIINLLLLLAVIGLVYVFMISGEVIEGEDQRQAIVLAPAERAFVLTEMRSFLTTVQGVTDAISRQDMETVAGLAKASGTAATAGTPVTLMKKLPLPFKQIGLSVHRDFDQLALDAEQLGDPAHSLRQLADITAKCVACHASYQFSLEH
jgi:hypothetical protein